MRTQIVACLLSVLLGAQPPFIVDVVTASPIDAPDCQPAVSTASADPERMSSATTGGAIELVTGTSQTDANRVTVTAQLVDLGYAPGEASSLASQLTPADLAVLSANPDMMQRAGDLSQTTTAYIIGGLIIAGIVVLAANGSGFVSVN